MDELWCFNLNNFTSIAKLTENRAALSCLVSIKLLFLEFFNFNFLVSLLSNSYRHFHSSHSYNSAAAAKSLQSCPTLCDPIDGSPLGSPVPGILQARTLEWVAISFSNAWKWKVQVKSLSHVRLSDPMDCSPPGCPWDFPGKRTGLGCHCLLYLQL